MYFSKATIIAVAALLSTGYALPAATGSCPDQAAACRSSGGSGCDAAAKSCCDSTIPVRKYIYVGRGPLLMLLRLFHPNRTATTGSATRTLELAACFRGVTPVMTALLLPSPAAPPEVLHATTPLLLAATKLSR